MKQAWFKFYPTDWRADPRLMLCSLAAQGMWMRMICIMHEAEKYGHLTVNNVQISGRMLAKDLGIDGRYAEKLLNELELYGVFDRAEDGTIICRRMVRDYEKSQRDSANGRRGGNPNLVKQGVKEGVNPPVKAEDKAQNPESRIQMTPTESTRAKKGPLPLDFSLTERRRQYGRAQGWGEQKTETEFSKFCSSAIAHGRRYANWDAAWCNWTTSNFQTKGNGNGSQKQHPVERALQLADDMERALEREVNSAGDFAGSGEDAIGLLEWRRPT